MRKIKMLASFLCVCLLFIGIGEGFRYILIDDTSSYTRLMMHELYESEENIDVLFIGSSHCYRSLWPQITDEMMGVHTFNAGSSSQRPDGTYAVIREAARTHDLDHIYLEVYYSVLGETYKERNEMTGTYILSDYMRPSLAKLEFLLNASSQKHYVNSFVLARRNWKKIFDADYVMNLIREKRTESYKTYAYDADSDSKEHYAGKGFVASDGGTAPGAFTKDSPFTSIHEKTIGSDSMRMLRKIIEFCEKEEIGLTLFAAPMSDFQLCSVGNYDEYVPLIENLIAGTSVEFYDFNLCKPEYFSYDASLFKDAGHLNTEGARIFSELFSRFFTGQIDSEALFYRSYEEKLSAMPASLFGNIIEKNPETGDLAITPVANCASEQIRYSINLLTGEDIVPLTADEPGPVLLPADCLQSGTLEISAVLNEQEVCSIRYSI